MMRRFFAQSWGLLLIFAAWQVWVMSAHYNSIVAVSPVAVVRDIVLHPVVYLTARFVDARLRAQRTCRGVDPGAAAGHSRVEIADPVRHHQSCRAAAQLDARGLPDTAVGAHLRLPEPDGVCHCGHHDFFPGLCFCQQRVKNLAAWVGRVLRRAGGNAEASKLLWLALPAAVPGMAVALRIGAAYSVMVTMISEYLMQTGGLGNMFALTSQAFETERAWGASLVAMALSVALYNAAGAVETRVRERYR